MKSTQVRFRVSERLHEELRSNAEQQSMTISELIRAAVRRELERKATLAPMADAE